MNEKYPYPEAEHYVFPTNNIEMLRQEMQRFPSGIELRKESTANVAFYRDSQFCNAMRSYAALSKLALANHHGPDTDTVGDHMTHFFAGTASAIHGLLYAAPRGKKEYILGIDPLGPVNDPDAPDSVRGPKVDALIEHMGSWHSVNGALAFDELDDELRELLDQYSDLLYEDIMASEEPKKTFLNGYVFAANAITLYGLEYDSFRGYR